MIVIRAGEFLRGSPATERGRYPAEGPQLNVKIARFAVAKFDVTFADWDACVSVGGCPEVGDSGWGRGTKPVHQRQLGPSSAICGLVFQDDRSALPSAYGG